MPVLSQHVNRRHIQLSLVRSNLFDAFQAGNFYGDSAAVIVRPCDGSKA